MEGVFQSFLTGFPTLILHFSMTVALLAIGVTIYIFLTPIKEIALIRQNNLAAAISFGGATIALAIPLASAMSSSVSAWDILIFGAVALVLQLICDKAASLMLRDVQGRIAKGEMAAAILLVSIKLGVSAINAAALNV
jgi:putative membrane protein